jgi:flavodoxin/NAD-dependent dihydropyrimidine dehydrogenase PreA subunit
MKVTMIYFSQTGNTRTVAETMAEAFREKGHVTRTISLKKATPQDATTSDLLGIGTPCYSSQAPTPVKAFLSTLPHLDKRHAFAFATSGGSPGRVLYDVSHLLQSKGADVIGGFITRGEVHHPAPCLVGRFPNRPNAEDLDCARDFAEAITEHVSASKAGLVDESRPDTLKPMERFYNAVALLSTDTFLRRLLPEPKLDLARCDRCQWCVYACPMHNITQQPYPVLGSQCIRCYRCLTGCPQRALNVNWRLSNVGVWMFYNTTFERWFGDVKPGESFHPEA